MVASARWRLLCLTLIGLGLAISSYLLARTFALLSNHADQIDVCSAVFGASCDSALLSLTSWQLGIPLAGWGVVYYGTLASLLVLGWVLGDAFEPEATLGMLLLAMAGAFGSLLLTVSVFTGRAPLCPLCLAVHALNLGLLPVLWRLSGRTARQLLTALRAGGKYLLSGQIDEPLQARWKVIGFVSAALFAIVMYQWVLVQSERRAVATGGGLDPRQVVAAYASTSKQDVSIDEDDPRLGPAEVPVHLVVFSDFQCPACRAFAQRTQYLRDQFPGKLAIIFKHYPLGTGCNRAVRINRHPQACQAAWAAEAASLQGKFWPFHDSLFASNLDASEDTIRWLAEEAELDLAILKTWSVCRSLLATMASLRKKGVVWLRLLLSIRAQPRITGPDPSKV